MERLGLSQLLAEFSSNLQWQDISAPGQDAARRLLMNSVALGIGASKHPTVELAIATFKSPQHSGPISLLGRLETFDMPTAALITGIAIHVEDFDDTHLNALVHAGAPIIPSALAIAEYVGASGTELLTAIAAGSEVAFRVANGMRPYHFKRGWHVTGTAGHVGAAIAASRLLQLDSEQTLAAIGLGATQAAGLTGALGYMAKSFHAGKAAADGVEAALLAAAGFKGISNPIEHQHGLAKTMSPVVDFEIMTRDLGEKWELEHDALKPYACGLLSHAVIDACIELKKSINGKKVIAVEIRVPHDTLLAMGILDPVNSLQSKFSVFHCAAVGLIEGAGGPNQFSDAAATDPTIRAMRQRTQVVVDPNCPLGGASVKVVTEDGEEAECEVPHATGSDERPMSDVQLRDKFFMLVEPILGTHETENTFQICQKMESQPGISNFLHLAKPSDGITDNLK